MSPRSKAMIEAQKRYSAKPEVKARVAFLMKEKYNTDPEYRLKKLASMKAYRDRKSAEELAAYQASQILRKACICV